MRKLQSHMVVIKCKQCGAQLAQIWKGIVDCRRAICSVEEFRGIFRENIQILVQSTCSSDDL